MGAQSRPSGPTNTNLGGKDPEKLSTRHSHIPKDNLEPEEESETLPGDSKEDKHILDISGGRGSRGSILTEAGEGGGGDRGLLKGRPAKGKPFQMEIKKIIQLLPCLPVFSCISSVSY